jgi:glycosyltransferase involved in cell wall biosynthesis
MPVPRVSVIIDTYNHERYIEQAIRSVLDQDFDAREMEIIVVDDGSTDRTAELARTFEPRIHLVCKPNGGQASAFNAAIPMARGKYVAFLDGDDWWHMDKLKYSVGALEENPRIAAVGHGFYEIREGASSYEIVVPVRPLLADLSSESAARVASRMRFFMGTCMITIRKSVLDRVGPVPEDLVFCADAPMHTLALGLGGVLVLDRPLFFYRYHSQNLFAQSGANSEKLRRRAQIMKTHLSYLPRRLTEFGVHPEIIKAFFEADEVDLARLQLTSGAGGRWKSFQAEMHDFKASHRSATLNYYFFKGLVIVLALVLPPKTFQKVRNWYARRGLIRIRKKLAPAEPAVPSVIFERRSITRPE